MSDIRCKYTLSLNADQLPAFNSEVKKYFPDFNWDDRDGRYVYIDDSGFELQVESLKRDVSSDGYFIWNITMFVPTSSAGMNAGLMLLHWYYHKAGGQNHNAIKFEEEVIAVQTKTTPPPRPPRTRWEAFKRLFTK